MAKRWKEVWSAGTGARRTYCGVARTVDGYAVDLFRGDSCIASEIHATRQEAEQTAEKLSLSYVHRSDSSIPANTPRLSLHGSSPGPVH
jgi:hypothetical protein